MLSKVPFLMEMVNDLKFPKIHSVKKLSNNASHIQFKDLKDSSPILDLVTFYLKLIHTSINGPLAVVTAEVETQQSRPLIMLNNLAAPKCSSVCTGLQEEL